MAFDWRKFLELSQHMVENLPSFPDDEACFRTSISRAYYAAFCSVRFFIRKTDGDRYNGGDAHFRVRKHFQESGDKKKRKIANQLQTIHSDRIKADYYDTLRERPRTLAYKTIRDAKKVIEEIQTL